MKSREQLQRVALSLRRWTATFTCALAERGRFHFRVLFAGSVDKDCHEREGHEQYEVHSVSQGGLGLVAGGTLLAHSTTPHLAGVGLGALSPQYRPPPPDHEPHYGAPAAEPRPSVIESSQPLIIECTWGLRALAAACRRAHPSDACSPPHHVIPRLWSFRSIEWTTTVWWEQCLVSTSGYEITIWTLSCIFVKYY